MKLLQCVKFKEVRFLKFPCYVSSFRKKANFSETREVFGKENRFRERAKFSEVEKMNVKFKENNFLKFASYVLSFRKKANFRKLGKFSKTRNVFGVKLSFP